MKSRKLNPSKQPEKLRRKWVKDFVKLRMSGKISEEVFKMASKLQPTGSKWQPVMPWPLWKYKYKPMAEELIGSLPEKQRSAARFLIDGRGVGNSFTIAELCSLPQGSKPGKAGLKIAELMLFHFTGRYRIERYGLVSGLLHTENSPALISLLAKRGLHDPDLVFRSWAARVLGRYASPAIVSSLIKSFQRESHEGMRASMAIVLGDTGSPHVVPFLLKAASSGAPVVRYASVDALGKLGDRRAILLLETLSKDKKNKYLAKKAKNSLRQIRKKK